MIPVWWSVLLTALGGLGWLLVTVERRIHGFAVGLLAQVAWVAYAVATGQWGFLGSAALFGAINAIGVHRWLRSRPRPPCAGCGHAFDRHGVNDFGDDDCVGPDARTSCYCDGYQRPRRGLPAGVLCECPHVDLVHMGLTGRCLAPIGDGALCDCPAFHPGRRGRSAHVR